VTAVRRSEVGRFDLLQSLLLRVRPRRSQHSSAKLLYPLNHAEEEDEQYGEPGALTLSLHARCASSRLLSRSLLQAPHCPQLCNHRLITPHTEIDYGDHNEEDDVQAAAAEAAAEGGEEEAAADAEQPPPQKAAAAATDKVEEVQQQAMRREESAEDNLLSGLMDADDEPQQQQQEQQEPPPPAAAAAAEAKQQAAKPPAGSPAPPAAEQRAKTPPKSPPQPVNQTMLYLTNLPWWTTDVEVEAAVQVRGGALRLGS